MKLVELTPSDWELILAWRSNPLLFSVGCYTQKEPLKWEEHYAWMLSRGHWWKFFLIIYENRKVGVVSFGQLDNWNPEFNYYLGEVSLWGKGVGKQALQMGLEWLKKHGYCRTHTTIRDDNSRSIGIVKSLGFYKIGKAREGESVWQIDLGEKDNATEYTSGRKEFEGA